MNLVCAPSPFTRLDFFYFFIFFACALQNQHVMFLVDMFVPRSAFVVGALCFVSMFSLTPVQAIHNFTCPCTLDLIVNYSARSPEQHSAHITLDSLQSAAAVFKCALQPGAGRSRSIGHRLLHRDAGALLAGEGPRPRPEMVRKASRSP